MSRHPSNNLLSQYFLLAIYFKAISDVIGLYVIMEVRISGICCRLWSYWWRSVSAAAVQTSPLVMRYDVSLSASRPASSCLVSRSSFLPVQHSVIIYNLVCVRVCNCYLSFVFVCVCASVTLHSIYWNRGAETPGG